MFGLGMGELALVLLVAFLVLGPTQVPKLMRDLGKTIRDLRRAGEDVKQQLVLDDEIRKPFEELREAMSIPIDALDAKDEQDATDRPATLDQPNRLAGRKETETTQAPAPAPGSGKLASAFGEAEGTRSEQAPGEASPAARPEEAATSDQGSATSSPESKRKS